MERQLSLFRVHDEIVSYYLETEALYSYLASLCKAIPEIEGNQVEKVYSHALQRIQWVVQQGNELRQLATDDYLWPFRQAHSQVFPGTILRDFYASYHDLAMMEADSVVSSLQISGGDHERSQEVFISDEWPTVFSPEGIEEVLSHHSDAFDDLGPVQGYLTLEAATAANMFPKKAIERSAADNGKPTGEDLTPRERNILEALGSHTMQARELSEKSGYQNNSNFRSALSNLVKRKHLAKTDDGYIRS